VLTLYLRFSPSIILPHPSSPLHKTISTSFIVLFSNKYKIHPPYSPSLFTFPSHTGTHPRTPVIYFLFFILKCILIVQGGFALVFQTCTYHALISSTPLLLTASPSQCSLIIQQSTVHYAKLSLRNTDTLHYIFQNPNAKEIYLQVKKNAFLKFLSFHRHAHCLLDSFIDVAMM
jgi:hypothetical protein